MLAKLKEKEMAIELRKQGHSYSEILKKVPVAKSTLSLWLRSVGLAKQQKQRLTEKRLAALKRGWETCRRKRILIINKIREAAKKEIKEITQRDLWLIGITLYWAEILSIPINQIRVYFKKHKINSKRKNVGKNDHGLMRIKVKRSINLNRKISAWIEKICELLHCGVV